MYVILLSYVAIIKVLLSGKGESNVTGSTKRLVKETQLSLHYIQSELLSSKWKAKEVSCCQECWRGAVFSRDNLYLITAKNKPIEVRLAHIKLLLKLRLISRSRIKEMLRLGFQDATAIRLIALSGLCKSLHKTRLLKKTMAKNLLAFGMCSFFSQHWHSKSSQEFTHGNAWWAKAWNSFSHPRQINKGYEFESETDTEVIPKLIKYIYDNRERDSVSFSTLVERVIQQLVSHSHTHTRWHTRWHAWWRRVALTYTTGQTRQPSLQPRGMRRFFSCGTNRWRFVSRFLFCFCPWLSFDPYAKQVVSFIFSYYAIIVPPLKCHTQTFIVNGEERGATRGSNLLGV